MFLIIQLSVFFLLSTLQCQSARSLLEKNNSVLIYSCDHENITLNCFGKSKQTSKFEWTFNKSVIDDQDNTTAYSIIGTSRNHSKLIIQNLSKQIYGLYTCTESNKNEGLSIENNFNLINASSNLTINIQHTQYLDNYLISVIFKNPPSIRGWNVKYFVDYICLSGSYKYCPKNWIKLSPCRVNTTTSFIKYSCFLEAKRIMYFNEYVVRASARLPCGWINVTSSFTVDLPETPKFENFKAKAIDYKTVKVSWKKVPLFSDLIDYDSESVKMRMLIRKSNRNITTQLVRELKSWDTSTMIHGFVPNENYSITASYRFVVMGLKLDPSKAAGPIFLQMPPKVIVSDSPLNQSCSEVKNKTGRYFYISWIMPPERGFIGKTITFDIKLHYGNKVTLMKIDDTSKRTKSIVIEAVRTITAEICICNEAGCSRKASVVCSSVANLKSNIGKKKSYLKYITGAALLAVCITIISLFCYLKKRKMKRKQRETTIQVLGPRHQYDEPTHQTTGADNLGQEAYTSIKDLKHSEVKALENDGCIVGDMFHNCDKPDLFQWTPSVPPLVIDDVHTRL